MVLPEDFWCSHFYSCCQFLTLFKRNVFPLIFNRFLVLSLGFRISQVKLATVVEGDQKAPFSIATTPRCRGGRYSFPWIAPLYPWYVPYIAECSARRYQVPFLKSLVWRDLGSNPGLPNHWQTLYPLGQWAGLEYIDCIPCWRGNNSHLPKNYVLGMTLNYIGWWDSNSVDLE